MLPKQFGKLPASMQTDEVRPYYYVLNNKRASLFVKRFFDIVISFIVLILLSPVIFIAALLIKLSSSGPVFYLQTRVGVLGKEFRIIKFRTMVVNADKMGTQVTVGERDPRITRIGYLLRVTRIDEFPQLINILIGDMSLVGTRPEVPRYVNSYTPEMMATLLLRPGISGEASIKFRHENEMLSQAENPEDYYIRVILPQKMAINLDYTKNLSMLRDFRVLFRTVACVFTK